MSQRAEKYRRRTEKRLIAVERGLSNVMARTDLNDIRINTMSVIATEQAQSVQPDADKARRYLSRQYRRREVAANLGTAAFLAFSLLTLAGAILLLALG